MKNSPTKEEAEGEEEGDRDRKHARKSGSPESPEKMASGKRKLEDNFEFNNPDASGEPSRKRFREAKREREKNDFRERSTRYSRPRERERERDRSTRERRRDIVEPLSSNASRSQKLTKIRPRQRCRDYEGIFFFKYFFFF